MLRRLLAADDPAARPDAIETFNPTALGPVPPRRRRAFAEKHGLPQLGNSDAHVASAIGAGWTAFPGRTPEDLLAALAAGETRHHGGFHGSLGQLSVFGMQLRKYERDLRAGVAGRVRRDGTGRDHGYPGGTRRPPRYDPPRREDAEA